LFFASPMMARNCAPLLIWRWPSRQAESDQWLKPQLSIGAQN
jgi:hypothetical protein